MTTSTTSPKELVAEWTAAMEGVTEGPWADEVGTTSGRVVVSPTAPKVRRNVASVGGQARDANARFIAFARNNAPALLATIQALEARAEAAEKQVVRAWNAFGPPERQQSIIAETAEDVYDQFAMADGDIAEQIVSLEAQLAASQAEAAALREALNDLTSWFPDEPSKPEWRIPAGKYGADDAIAQARALAGKQKDENND